MIKRIKFEIDFDKKLANNILKILRKNDAYYLDLLKKLRMDSIKPNPSNWNNLRFHLVWLEEEGFIEEAHYPDGEIVYRLETKGNTNIK